MLASLLLSGLAKLGIDAGMLPEILPGNVPGIVSGVLLGQTGSWLTIWLTPIWVLAVGILVGGLALAAILALMSGLSFTPLGKLADSPSSGRTASIAIGIVVAAILGFLVVPQAGEYQRMLILPVIVLGITLGFAFIYGVWYRTRSELWAMAREGVMPYLLGVAGVFMVIGLAATPLVEEPREILQSVGQVNLFGDGTEVVVRQLEAAPAELTNPDEAEFQKVPMDYVMFNVSELTVESDKTILIGDGETPADFYNDPVRINAGEPVRYVREEREAPPLPLDPDRVYMQNREVDPATVKITFVTRPAVPEAASIVTTAIGLVVFFLAYVALRQAAPRITAVAVATAKSEMAQPLYLLLILLGSFGLFVLWILPFNTLGDDIRMMKDSGVTLIMVLGMLQAVWSAGTSVSEEIEGRTALTVLSKPISRGSFLLGKYTGIMLTVLVLFVVLSALLIFLVGVKPIYEARENSQNMPAWQLGHEEIMTTIPALLLYLMETMAIGGIAVALATRLPLLANFVFCFVIYVIGNLTAPLVRSTMGENELVGFVGKLIAVVIPNLNTFNVQAAVDAGNPIPAIYLAGAFNYLICFCVMILMLALLMFEERDLA